MAEKTYKAAIIGCGNIASLYDTQDSGQVSTHAGAYTSHPRFSLVSACDIDSKRLSDFGKRWNVSALYKDMEKMLSEMRPEVVSICTPTQLHYDHLLVAVKYVPKAIICEKPLSTDPVQARYIVETCEKKSIPLFVNYVRRWSGPIHRLKDEIASGRFGKPVRVVGAYSKGLFHTGSHMIDMLDYFFGKPRFKRLISEKNFPFNGDASPSFSIEYEKGPEACLFSYDFKNFETFQADLIFERSMVRIEDFARKITYYSISGDKSICPAQTIEGMDNFFTNMLDNVVGAIENGKKPECGGREALETIVLCDQIKHAL